MSKRLTNKLTLTRHELPEISASFNVITRSCSLQKTKVNKVRQYFAKKEKKKNSCLRTVTQVTGFKYYKKLLGKFGEGCTRKILISQILNIKILKILKYQVTKY